MNTERQWAGIGPTNFTEDGLDTGIITVEDTACYKVKMKVVVFSDTLQDTALVINKILSRTQMKLGPIGGKITEHTDMSDFLISDRAKIRSVADQDRPSIPPADYERASYEEEPTMAKRTVSVDKYGEIYSENNRFPVSDKNIKTLLQIMTLDVFNIPTVRYVIANDQIVTDKDGNIVKADQ
jgi:hypothetical protein